MSTVAQTFRNKDMESLAYLGSIFAKICADFVIKSVVSGFFVFAAFFFDALQKEAMYALLALIIFDFITAIHAALVTGERIESAKVFRTAVKIATYFLLVSAGYMTDKAMPFHIVDETILAFLAVTELISILENTSRAGYAVPVQLMERLKSFNRLK